MLNIEECTYIWKCLPEASVESFKGDYMILNYSYLKTQKEVDYDIARMKDEGFIATPHGNGIMIWKEG